jgi:hypothetical protein
VRQKKAGVWSNWTGGGGTAAPFDALAYNGMQVNGSMDVSQERGYTVTTNTNSSTIYIVDGFYTLYTHATAVFQSAQITLTGAGTGLQNGLKLIATTGGNVGAAAGDIARISTNIEGYRVARLNWGTSLAQPITIAFIIYVSITGTVCVSVRNNAFNRSYLADVPVTGGIWQYKTITVPGDTTGTWTTDNTIGLRIDINSLAGTTYRGVAGWQAGAFLSTGSTTNQFATNNSQMVISGFGVWPGLDAPSVTALPNVMRPYDQELATCKRYWQIVTYNWSTWHGDGNAYASTIPLPVSMRVTPTLDVSGMPATGTGGNIAGYPQYGASTDYFSVVTAGAGANLIGVNGTMKLNARL